MLDIKLVRDDPERVRAALARRGPGVADLYLAGTSVVTPPPTQ